MVTSISAFSSRTITPQSLGDIMTYLRAVEDQPGEWKLERKARYIVAVLASDDIPDFPPEIVRKVAEVLGAQPKSRVSLIYDGSAEDELESRMAIAVAMALSERFPIAISDHASLVQRVYPPGLRSR